MDDTLHLLYIGSTITEADREYTEQVSAHAGNLDILIHGPVSQEPALLDAVDIIVGAEASMLVIFVLNGGSARLISLAAMKCRVPIAVICHDTRHSLASSAIAAGALS